MVTEIGMKMESKLKLRIFLLVLKIFFTVQSIQNITTTLLLTISMPRDTYLCSECLLSDYFIATCSATVTYQVSHT